MPSPATTRLHALQLSFLSILPRIERHGRVYFRHVRCPDRKADAIAEMVALSWRWFVRLAQRNKDATKFPSTLATFAARAVHSGRRLCGAERAKGALSPVAQRSRGFQVGRLPDFSTLNGNPLSEALQDNTQSPVLDQVAFRFDFSAWLTSLGARDPSIAQDMAQGHRTGELAETYGLSPARVSQLRRKFHCDWHTFCGEPTPTSLSTCDSCSTSTSTRRGGLGHSHCQLLTVLHPCGGHFLHCSARSLPSFIP
jgi:hypothetical protein